MQIRIFNNFPIHHPSRLGEKRPSDNICIEAERSWRSRALRIIASDSQATVSAIYTTTKVKCNSVGVSGEIFGVNETSRAISVQLKASESRRFNVEFL